jgi:hypothetical protein
VFQQGIHHNQPNRGVLSFLRGTSCKLFYLVSQRQIRAHSTDKRQHLHLV